MINAYHIKCKMCQNIIKCQKLKPIWELFSEDRKLYMEIRAHRNTISELEPAMYILFDYTHTYLDLRARRYTLTIVQKSEPAKILIRNTNQNPQEYQKIQPARKLLEPTKPQLKIKTLKNTMSIIRSRTIIFCK